MFVEKLEDHFLALQTYGYSNNALPSEVRPFQIVQILRKGSQMLRKGSQILRKGSQMLIL